MIDIVRGKEDAPKFLAYFREYALSNRERTCAEQPLHESIELYHIEAGEEAPDHETFYRIRNGLINAQLVSHRTSSHGKSREVHLYGLTERGRELADIGVVLREQEEAELALMPKKATRAEQQSDPVTTADDPTAVASPSVTESHSASSPVEVAPSVVSSPSMVQPLAAPAPVAVPVEVPEPPPPAQQPTFTPEDPLTVPVRPGRPRSQRLVAVPSPVSPPRSPAQYSGALPIPVLLLISEEARLKTLDDQVQAVRQARDAQKYRVETLLAQVIKDPELHRHYDSASADLHALIAEKESAAE